MIGERLKQVRLHLGLTQSEFGTLFKLKQASITDLERGQIQPSVQILQVLHERHSINLNWLVSGSGDMKTTDTGHEQLKEKYVNLLEEYVKLKK